MKQLLLLITSASVAVIDPFLPFGSLVMAFSSVIGTRLRSWWGLAGVLIAGLVYDVTVSGQLGLTSSIATLVWALSAGLAARSSYLFPIVIITAAIGASVPTAVNQSFHLVRTVITAAAAGGGQLIWQMLADRGGGIKLRRR